MGDIMNYSIFDLDVTGLIEKKGGNPLGDAHELFVKSIMMRLGFSVGSMDLSSGATDIVIFGKENPNGEEIILRTQVKTGSSNTKKVTSSIPLIAGGRGGIDREYKSSVKVYKYDKSMIELLIGVDKFNLDLYLIPSFYFDKFGNSISTKKIPFLKNNWDMLMNWNENYLNKLYNEFQ